MSIIFRPLLNKNTSVYSQILDNIIGVHKDTYFDYTASGLAYKVIEDRIQEVLQTYANTHSKDALMSATTDNYYRKAREHLRTLLELDENFSILPSGCGATASIKRFQEIVGLYIPPATKERYSFINNGLKLPLVIVGPYEHHSNEISYREALCDVIRIGMKKDGLIDLEQLKQTLEANKNREIIGSFCIASNVTGIITPYKKISKLLRQYNAIVCFDAATSSAYMNVDCNIYDVMVFSSHKLLGGPGSCGVLAIRKKLINSALPPTFAGGGTVSYVSRKSHTFVKNIEDREDAGTPGIIQLIRSALAYQLRNEIGFKWIKNRKTRLYKYLKQELNSIKGMKCYGCDKVDNIGIISLNIENVNPYKLCTYLSYEKNFHTRAGCSCAGPYGHDLLGLDDNEDINSNIKNKPGWLRISLHYSHNIQTINALIKSIKEYLLHH